MAEKLLRVECYAGYKGDERPVKLQIDEQMLEITEVEDRWYFARRDLFPRAAGERRALRFAPRRRPGYLDLGSIPLAQLANFNEQEYVPFVL